MSSRVSTWSVSDIDLNWLNRVLESNWTPRANEITAFHTDGSAGRGFLSNVQRIALTYRSPDAGLPSSVIVKMPSDIPAERAEGDHFDAYRRETAFYRHCANSSPCRPPHHYYSSMDDDAYVIVMEDLKHCRFVDQVDGMGVDDTLAVFRGLARMHAQYWQSAELAAMRWLPPFTEFGRIYPPRVATGRPLAIQNFGRFYSPAVLNTWDDAVRAFPTVVQRMGTRPGTMIHVDARADNVAFEPIPGSDGARFLDWQLVSRGPGAFDVTYFLMHSMDTDLCREAFDDLIGGYHDELMSNGVHGYTLADLKDDMGLCGCFMYAFLAWVANFVLPDEKGLAISARTIPRFCALMEDLDVPDRVRALA